MQMRAAPVRNGFIDMAVDMDVLRAIAVLMLMKMYAVAPQPPQHVRAETHQHDADRRLQRTRETLGDRVAEQNRRTREHEQRQRMAETPCQAVLDDVADVGPARGNARHRRDVIGLQRMLHTQ